VIKTSDVDRPAQFSPSIIGYKLGQHHFQGNAVQPIFWLPVIHKMSLNYSLIVFDQRKNAQKRPALAYLDLFHF
jgi:hypothetical protein